MGLGLELGLGLGLGLTTAFEHESIGLRGALPDVTLHFLYHYSDHM